VCRPMKVGKEEVIGCLTAVETWLKIDPKKTLQRVERARGIASLKLVQTGGRRENGDIRARRRKSLPHSKDFVGPAGVGVHSRRLRSEIAGRVIQSSKCSVRTTPALCLQYAKEYKKPNRKERKETDHIELVSMTIKPGEEMIVGQRLRAILGSARKGKSA